MTENLEKLNGKKVKFKEWDCVIKIAEYQNGRTAILLEDAIDGEPIATATVNLPEEKLNEGYVFIKDWSENNGMTAALILAGIVEPHNGWISVGRFGSVAGVCKLKFT